MLDFRKYIDRRLLIVKRFFNTPIGHYTNQINTTKICKPGETCVHHYYHCRVVGGALAC